MNVKAVVGVNMKPKCTLCTRVHKQWKEEYKVDSVCILCIYKIKGGCFLVRYCLKIVGITLLNWI